jgi:excisionase family DNA binding protein
MNCNSSKSPEPLAVCSREAAKMLTISERTLWSLTKARAVPHVRLGRRTVYPVAELKAWLSARVAAGMADAAAE